MPSRVASCPFPLAARGAGETSTYGRLRQRTHCSMYIYGMVLSAGDGRTAPLGQTRGPTCGLSLMLTGYQAFETLAMEAGKWRAGVLALLMMLRNERGWRAVVVWMDPRLCLPRLADRGVPVTREAWAFVLAWRECASWDRRSMGKSSPSVQLMTLRARRTPWGIPLG
jgi:hypothetical protein